MTYRGNPPPRGNLVVRTYHGDSMYSDRYSHHSDPTPVLKNLPLGRLTFLWIVGFIFVGGWLSFWLTLGSIANANAIQHRTDQWEVVTATVTNGPSLYTASGEVLGFGTYQFNGKQISAAINTNHMKSGDLDQIWINRKTGQPWDYGNNSPTTNSIGDANFWPWWSWTASICVLPWTLVVVLLLWCASDSWLKRLNKVVKLPKSKFTKADKELYETTKADIIKKAAYDAALKELQQL